MEAKKVTGSSRTVGWAIRRLRVAQHLNQSELAAVADTDAANLSRLERGAQDFPEHKLRAIAERLGVTVSTLYHLAEIGDEDLAALMGLLGRLSANQAREVEKFAGYVLARDSSSDKT